MMASAPRVEDSLSLTRKLEENQGFHFNILFRENERNQSNLGEILDRLEKLEMKMNTRQNDNLSEDNSFTCNTNESYGCSEQLLEENTKLKEKIFALENDLNTIKFHRANPNCPLTPHSVINRVCTNAPYSSLGSGSMVQQLEKELDLVREENLRLKRMVEPNETSRRQNYTTEMTSFMPDKEELIKMLQEKSSLQLQHDRRIWEQNEYIKDLRQDNYKLDNEITDSQIKCLGLERELNDFYRIKHDLENKVKQKDLQLQQLEYQLVTKSSDAKCIQSMSDEMEKLSMQSEKLDQQREKVAMLERKNQELSDINVQLTNQLYQRQLPRMPYGYNPSSPCPPPSGGQGPDRGVPYGPT